MGITLSQFTEPLRDFTSLHPLPSKGDSFYANTSFEYYTTHSGLRPKTPQTTF